MDGPALIKLEERDLLMQIAQKVRLNTALIGDGDLALLAFRSIRGKFLL